MRARQDMELSCNFEAIRETRALLNGMKVLKRFEKLEGWCRIGLRNS
jgi:hypothetical protein